MPSNGATSRIFASFTLASSSVAVPTPSARARLVAGALGGDLCREKLLGAGEIALGQLEPGLGLVDFRAG